MGKPWGAPTSWDEVCRRAAGRARYHAMRRAQRVLRRRKVLRLLRRYGCCHGVQARIARELGVSEATVSRDVAALLLSQAPCPCCGTVIHRDRLNPR
jgi:predicted DNA-binding transcriptional regulator YafY